MPSSRQARAIRIAISPRFAIRTLSNISLSPLSGRQLEERFAVLDGFVVGLEDIGDPAMPARLDRNHRRQRLDDPALLTGADGPADCHKRPRPWRACVIEPPDSGRGEV